MIDKLKKNGFIELNDIENWNFIKISLSEWLNQCSNNIISVYPQPLN